LDFKQNLKNPVQPGYLNLNYMRDTYSADFKINNTNNLIKDFVKSSNKTLILLSFLSFVISIILIISMNGIAANICEFVRINISNDHYIQGGVKSFKTNLFFVALSFFGLAIILIMLSRPAIQMLLKDFFWNTEVRNYLFKDNYVSPSFSKIVFISSAAGNLLIVIIFQFYQVRQFMFLFGEDKFFEWLTAIFYLVSSFVLMIGVIRIFKNKNLKYQYRKLSLIALLFFSFLIFWVFGEEISWGQRIFNWQTTELFEMNFQNETNLHNFFNPIINSVYSFVTFTLVVILLIGWIRNREKSPKIFQIVFPHSSLLPAAIFILFASQGEMSEVILSFFVLFYCLRIFLVSTAKNPGLSST
jgi:hypothetical protein